MDRFFLSFLSGLVENRPWHGRAPNTFMFQFGNDPWDNEDADFLRVIAESFEAPFIVKKDITLDVRPRNLKHRKRCTICQARIETTELAVHLSCKHYYHADCIMEWGKHKPTCPVCRTEIPVKT